MITAALSDLKDHLSSYVKKAAKEEILITNHGKPVGVIKGFANEDEYLEYRLLSDPRFHRIVGRSRKEAWKGKVTKLDDLG
jgi:prevent-host-death family protein